MPHDFQLQLLLATFAGWVNRRQAQVIDYLVEENRVLWEQLKGRRLRLTDGQRRRLAAKGKMLGRGRDRRGGLLHDGGLDATRSSGLLRPIRHPPCHACRIPAPLSGAIMPWVLGGVLSTLTLRKSAARAPAMNTVLPW